MSAISALGLIAFLLCLGLTPLCRDLFLRFNIIDHPDAERKFHRGRIPRIGGIPIVLSYAGSMGILFLLAPRGATLYVRHQKLLLSMLPAAAIVFLTGLLDDLIGLKPRQKLAGQVVAAVLAVSLGARVSMLQDLPVSLWVSVPFSLVWLIGCTNAVNLIDGLDGLASGVGLFATLATLAAAVMSGNLGLATATIPLAGCLLAFLRYNFSPASIFLGDCGSLTIGFLLGCFGLIWSQHGGTLFGMALPLMTLALPLLDVLLAIGRRALRSVPIFKGDRGHIHHMVLARGFKPHTSALILYGFCAFTASLALLQTFTALKFRGLIFLVFGGLIWVGINYLNYVELKALRKLFSHKHLLALVKDEIHLHELEGSIAKAKSADDFWQVVRTSCIDLRVSNARMLFTDRVFEESFSPKDNGPLWVLTVPLGETGQLILTRSAEVRSPKFMLRVIEQLQDAALERERLIQAAGRIHSRAA